MGLGLNEGAVELMVNLNYKSYPVIISPALLEKAGGIVNANLADVSKCVIITDRVVGGLYSNSLERSLEGQGIHAASIWIPEGEEAKSWNEAGDLIGSLIDMGVDRRSLIIALGGGVVGDISGFVAAVYLRGVRLIQVPTTLLAQVDSSIGGKTAVNHEKGKNLIGVFKQPNVVLIDPGVLKTLPLRELKSGLAEVVKYAVIADAELFKIIEAEADRLINGEIRAFSKIVPRCCRVKIAFVEQDERDEKGIRAALNYGHTVGHALEVVSSFGIRHGEAVAIGMEVAAKISTSQGLMEEEDFEEQHVLFKRLGISTKLPNIDPITLVEYMHRDKKAERGSIRLVLPTGIGEKPVIRPVEDALILKTLEKLRSNEA
ncbi:3-dehydroquinate synthase [Candidatus Bathyarchaeota archaeon]|nr:3-dehydroquinate synthase [Candidatus Bathyarchaeota archaeon]